MLTASVVVPTPPFGLEERDDLTGAGLGAAVGGDPTGSDQERLDPRRQLGRREAGGDHVIGASLQERDAGLDVVSRRDDEDRRDPAFGVATRMRPMAPDDRQPSATIRSNGSSRIVATASAGVVDRW